MDRAATLPVERLAAVRAVGPAAIDVLLPPAGRDGREPGANAADRRAVPQMAILRQPEVGLAALGQSQARAAADAADGNRGDLSQATNDLARRWAQDLPVFTAKR